MRRVRIASTLRLVAPLVALDVRELFLGLCVEDGKENGIGGEQS